MTDFRYAYSRVTDTWYIVTEWDDREGSGIVAHSKEEVDRSEVPSVVRAEVDERQP